MKRLNVRDRVMTSHDACTSEATRVLTVVSAVEDGGSYYSSRRMCTAACVKVPIGIHRQLCQQSFPLDFPLLVAQNCHGAPVVQKFVRQVGAKATDTRIQSNANGVSIDICGPSFLTPQQIPFRLAALAQMVACLPLVQQVRGSIPGGVVNFNLKIFNLGARRGGTVHFLIARLYITVLD